MSIGAGIAIVGIWIGVGLVAFGAEGAVIPTVALCAMMATGAVAFSD